MIAVFRACALGFLRDRGGLAMTLLLPPLVYLLFASVFGSSSRGEIEASLSLYDEAQTPASRALEQDLRSRLGRRQTTEPDAATVEAAVVAGRADVGAVLRPGANAFPDIEILTAAGREVAAAAVAGQVRRMAVVGPPPPGAPEVRIRTVGPPGDAQSVYYAGAVSIMFVFFAAMHGAMTGLDDRRSGLQARLSLVAGGLGPILAGRAAWLTVVGVAQSLTILAVAAPNLPPTQPWQIAAWMFTALLASVAAAGIALAVIALCRSRDQAQPLSTFVVLLMAALGGSMAPRFLMPDLIRQLGWATPHAWAIEAGQTLLWQGVMDKTVIAAWAVLGAAGIAGGFLALRIETRRAPV